MYKARRPPTGNAHVRWRQLVTLGGVLGTRKRVSRAPKHAASAIQDTFAASQSVSFTVPPRAHPSSRNYPSARGGDVSARAHKCVLLPWAGVCTGSQSGSAAPVLSTPKYRVLAPGGYSIVASEVNLSQRTGCSLSVAFCPVLLGRDCEMRGSAVKFERGPPRAAQLQQGPSRSSSDFAHRGHTVWDVDVRRWGVAVVLVFVIVIWLCCAPWNCLRDLCVCEGGLAECAACVVGESETTSF